MKYLIFETELGAKTRSAQEYLNRGGIASDVTKYWWSWRETLAGAWALFIPDADVSSLSEAEQAALVDSVQWPVEEI
jgi:hypothetical protein